MIQLIIRDELGDEFDTELDLSQFTPDRSGNCLDNEREGMQVVNAVALALENLYKEKDSHA